MHLLIAVFLPFLLLRTDRRIEQAIGKRG